MEKENKSEGKRAVPKKGREAPNLEVEGEEEVAEESRKEQKQELPAEVKKPEKHEYGFSANLDEEGIIDDWLFMCYMLISIILKITAGEPYQAGSSYEVYQGRLFLCTGDFTFRQSLLYLHPLPTFPYFPRIFLPFDTSDFKDTRECFDTSPQPHGLLQMLLGFGVNGLKHTLPSFLFFDSLVFFLFSSSITYFFPFFSCFILFF